MRKKTPEHLKDRLPKGQVYTEKWPVLHEGKPLTFDPASWRLHVHGLIEAEKRFTWEEFLAWPKATFHSDFHCVTTWSNFDNEWQGTLFKDFVSIVKPKPEARYVRFLDHQGYDTSVDLASLLDNDVVLATHWNGKPLSPDHGGPMRLVVPKRYAWKSCKWLVEVEFRDQDKLGYWETRGYHNHADPFSEERFS